MKEVLLLLLLKNKSCLYEDLLSTDCQNAKIRPTVWNIVPVLIYIEQRLLCPM